MTQLTQWEWMRPQLLWLSVAVAVWLVWLHVRSLSDFPRWQRRLSLAIRMLVMLLITAALAGLVLLSDTDRRMIVVAIDRSASIDEAAAVTADEFAGSLLQAAEAANGTEVRFLAFNRSPGELSVDPPAGDTDAEHSDAVATRLVADNEEEAGGNGDDAGESKSPTATQSLSQKGSDPLRRGQKHNDNDSPPKGQTPFRTGSQQLDDDSAMGTDIAAAIRTATASIPPSYVAEVVIVSDGNQTAGDAVAAAASAGVPVSTIPLPARSEPEVQLAAIEAPPQVRQGEPFYLEVVVNSNGPATGHLDFYRDDIRIGEDDESVELRAGENRFRIRQTISDRRQATFAARLRGFGDADTLLDNNEATAIVSAAGRPRVLLVDPDVDHTDSLRWALGEQKIDVEVRPAEGVPRDLAELQGYECLILSNVPATAMTMRQMDLIRTYVQELGGGLVMLGGDQAFGLGGYYRTSLEEILPVRSNFEKEREKPSLAMVLVIDKSGSMSGEKMELAKDAAKAAVELLGPKDSVGVIAFDSSSTWVTDLRPAADKYGIIDQISTIQPGGGTDMYPPMEDAYRGLLSASAKLKHCILLTDGISSPGDFEGLAAEMAASGMTVTTVAMGADASEDLLESIARIGGGRYYFCDDPQSVPQVFAKETVEASQSAINELPFLPQQVRPTQVLEGIDLETAPLLLGYVVTRPKPTGEFILASESGDPLLVWWRYGLGMSVAFTSDAKARWAAEWLDWPDFGTFWAQVIRHAMRSEDTHGFFVDVRQRDGETTVVVDSVDDQGGFVDDRPTTLTVITPQLQREKPEMRQTAPGRYETVFAAPRRGTYQLELSQERSDGETVRQSRGVVIGYPDELRLLPTDETTLRQIAEASGGRFAPSVSDLIAGDGRTARRPIPLWPYLLMAALALFVLDVALRRLELGRR